MGKEGFYPYLTMFSLLAALILLSAILNSEARRERLVFKTMSRIHEFDNCRDRPLRPFRILQRKIYQFDVQTYALSAEGICDKSSTAFEMIVVNLTKCSDRSKSKCEYIKQLSWRPAALICPLFSLRGTMWDSILAAFSPSLGCVYPKGRFTVRNLTVDVNAVQDLRVDSESLYVSSFEFLDEKRVPWLCFVIEMEYPRVRV